MIPPVPLTIRITISVALMAAAVVLARAANWIVPEMQRKEF